MESLFQNALSGQQPLTTLLAIAVTSLWRDLNESGGTKNVLPFPSRVALFCA